MAPKLRKCADCQTTEMLLTPPPDNGDLCQECYVVRQTRMKLIEDLKYSSNENREDDNKEKNLIDEEEKLLIKEEETNNNKADTGEKDDINKMNKEDTVATTASPTATTTTPTTTTDEKRNLRKSTRSTRYKLKSATASAAANGNAQSNGATGAGNTSSGKATKGGRSRRNIFKKTPYKLPVVKAQTRFAESVFYKGSYMQIGDIVSLTDNDGNVYYAQIRGLLIDSYCEKSAFLTWLIPTQDSPDPKNGFDPATYLIGPDEELSRKLSYLEFIMHAPSNYYLDRSTPFPLPDTMDNDTKCTGGGFIWTTLSEYKRKEKIP